MRVFYSWQSDSPSKCNRNLIQGALRDATEQLNEEIALDVADRGDPAIVLDQDTQGELGSVEVARTIMKKIRNADVVICDVTLVAKGKDGKPHINSNVAIEYGYALGAIGHEPIVKVMNAAFGSAETLPFDLTSRRHPVKYEAPENLTKSGIKEARKKLCEALKPILKAYFDKHAEPEPVAAHTEEPSSTIKTIFWKNSEVVARYNGSVDQYCEGFDIVAVRIIPKHKQERLTQAKCLEHVGKHRAPFFLHGSCPSRNDYGALMFNGHYEQQQVLSGLQLFKSREVWSFSKGIIWQETDDNAHNGMWMIHYETIMRTLPDAISDAANLAREVISGPMQIRVIADGLDSVHAMTGKAWLPSPSRISEKTIAMEETLTDDIDSNNFAFRFAQMVYEEAGLTLANNGVK